MRPSSSPRSRTPSKRTTAQVGTKPRSAMASSWTSWTPVARLSSTCEKPSLSRSTRRRPTNTGSSSTTWSENGCLVSGSSSTSFRDGSVQPSYGGDPHRLFRLELPGLARARVSERAASAPLARALREALRHGRDQRHLLPASEPLGCGPVGRRDPAEIPLLRQGEPLPDPREAPHRPRARSWPLLRADRAAHRIAKDGPCPLAASRQLSTGRRAARRRTRPATHRPPLLRVQARELVLRRRLRPPPRPQGRACDRRPPSTPLPGSRADG